MHYTTVDDFGYDDAVNKLIVEGIAGGVVSRASVMVNLPGSEWALEYIKRHQSSSTQFGLHLNLTEGRPVLDASLIPSLVNGQGMFLGWGGFIKRSLLGQLNYAQVTAEVQAQLDQAPWATFLNSHHHIHLWPPLARMISDIAHKQGIDDIRRPQQFFWPAVWQRYGYKALIIQLLGIYQSRIHRQCSTDYFIDLDWAGVSDQSRKRLKAMVPKEAELSCHPHAFEIEHSEINTKDSTLAWLIKHLESKHRTKKQSLT